MSPRRRRRASAALAGAALLLPWAASCGGEGAGPEADGVGRETFIATYVDLRAAALSSPDAQLAEQRREEILQAHGVTEEELLRFAETHGRDVDYMASVWAEIEQRLDLMRSPPDTSS